MPPTRLGLWATPFLRLPVSVRHSAHAPIIERLDRTGIAVGEMTAAQENLSELGDLLGRELDRLN